MVIISVCLYCVKVILKFRWESGEGGPWNPHPLCTNERSEYLIQLSVDIGYASFGEKHEIGCAVNVISINYHYCAM